jgi:periplasmic protein TonB
VSIETSSGSTSLDEAALEAVRKWHFVPARRGAQAVEAWHLVPIVFKLEGGS